MPRLDVTENVKTFTVTAELPSISEKEIDLSIFGDTLTIKGEKKEEKEDTNKNYHHSERFYGSFMRSVPRPRHVDTDKMTASFKKGVLTIALPKTAAAVDAKKYPSRSTSCWANLARRACLATLGPGSNKLLCSYTQKRFAIVKSYVHNQKKAKAADRND